MQKIMPQESNIKGIRLIGDAEIIGKFEIASNGDVVIDNPLRVLTGRDEKGNLIVDIVPVTLLTDVLSIPYHAQMSKPFALDKDMEDAYLQRTSGIPGLQLA